MIGDVKGTGNRVHVCAVCGDEFRRWTDAGVYCSRACMSADYADRFTGADNPAWRGGKWKYKGRGWSDIAGAVIKRDGACADCGATTGLLAHHLIPQRFWIDLDAANQPDNLLTLCGSCHGKRPEHYWKRLPVRVKVEGVHISQPTRRSGEHLRPYPDCEMCGLPCKRHRSRFCSVACANRDRWQRGVYDADALADRAADAARARWQRR